MEGEITKLRHSADTMPKPSVSRIDQHWWIYHFAEPPRTDVSVQNTLHPPIRNHLSHTTQGAVLCMMDVSSPLPPSACSCPLPSVSPWKENGGGGVALSPMDKHLFHLGSCLSLRRGSVTGCPRRDHTEGRLLPAVCYGASGISPDCPLLVSQPV